jgi:glycosyltransferase involved in cell wall biosynthesis
VAGCPFDPGRHWLLGTVGRMHEVKHQTLLTRAFVRAAELSPALRASGRLMLVGDGPLRAECEAILARAGLADSAWLAGERHDVPEVLRGLSCFVLPSLAEGISNTILEAMATGLPVIACAVGGNVELVDHGRTGLLVAPDDVEAMAAAIVALHGDAACARAMGQAGRQDVERRFSMQAMVSSYLEAYAPGLGIASTGAHTNAAHNAPSNAQTGR